MASPHGSPHHPAHDDLARPLDLRRGPVRAAAESEELSSEVVVVGGGPAGLAAAVALARSRRDVIVVDAGAPRNASAHAAHNVLGQEGIAPFELLARGRAEAAAYGVRFVDGAVTSATGAVDDFVLRVDDGRVTVRGRRVILATGLQDELPEVPGVADGWGQSVLHCPYCHGWEVRDRRIAVLARDAGALHQVLLFRQLSEEVTLLLHDAPVPTDEQRAQLDALGVPVETSRVARLVLDGRRVRAVEFEDGRAIEIDAVAVAPRFRARADVYGALGGSVTEAPYGSTIAADERGGTAIPGVWVAGNAGNAMAMVVASAASGVLAGAAVNADLALADVQAEVGRRAAAAAGRPL